MRPMHRMRGRMALGLTTIGLALASGALATDLAAQSRGAGSAGDTTFGAPGLPLPTPRAATFTTDEGTWMSVDVSPDGKTIVFDLVGDLYLIPIAGGKATRITDGPGFDCMPRFSPDGKRVLFQSDRSGAENLYTVELASRQVRAVTKEPSPGFISPAWSPDGRYIAVAKDDYMGVQYKLYLYPVDGGSPVQLSGGSGGGRPGAPSTTITGDVLLGPTFSPDNRYLYFSVRKLGSIGNVVEFTDKIDRYEFETGEQQEVVVERRGAFRPLVSRDGRWLVYGVRRDTSTSLRLRELSTGEERWLIHQVQRSDQESWSKSDILPGYAFTPDSKAIVTAFNGKIWRVEVPSGKATMIPFSADVNIPLGELVRFDYPINDSVVTATLIRNPQLSPDNRRVVFTALDRLYVMDLPDGKPRRLTSADVNEQFPIWSPDGRWIAYVTWDDFTGAIYRVRADGSGAPERLTKQPGYYQRVNYTPDGTRLVTMRADQPFWLEYNRLKSRTWLAWIPATGGSVTAIRELPDGDPRERTVIPYFLNRDSSRIYLETVSSKWDGSDIRDHLGRGRVTFSPDGKRTLSSNFDVQLGVTPLTKPIPSYGDREISLLWGEHPSWSPDGTKIVWAAGRQLFIYDVARADAAIADSIRRANTPGVATDAKMGEAYVPERITVTITAPTDRPNGIVALCNARIVTMRGDEVIERGDIVITRSRITAIGPAGTIAIPANAQTFDLSGKTIIPGLVDVHAHPYGPEGVHARQLWDYAAPLAYGITTIRIPGSGGTEHLSYQDKVATGTMIGPRVFSAGPGITKDPKFYSLAGTREILRPYAEYLGVNTVKQYAIGDRKERQHFLMVAKELRLTQTLEGAAYFRKNLTEAIDGYAGSEHTYPNAPLFRDVVEVIARSGITYTPTLLVNYGGPEGADYMYQHYQNMYNDPKLRHFTLPELLERKFKRRESWFADDQYAFSRFAAQAAKIVHAGGRVGLGGHGELPGLGDHWELWLLQSGGMTPLEALRCGTLFGAESIGLGKDIGSLEVGKLADLIVLDKNPLDDIRNSIATRYVMKNGRLYDGNTLDEVWPTQKKMPLTWWMESGSADR